MAPTRVARFADRSEAGRALARPLAEWLAHRLTPEAADRVIVLGLPRGGVPVAAEVAAALDAPFDVFLVRKLGAPGQPELAMGAIAGGGLRVLNPGVVEHLGVTEAQVEETVRRERAVLDARERDYRGDAGPVDVAGATVVLVDDGLATGATMKAALHAVRRRGPSAVVVAVPVAAPETAAAFEREPEVDGVVTVITPEPFFAVGLWYDNFEPVTDAQVRASLRNLHTRGGTPP